MSEYDPTIETSFQRQVKIDRETCMLHIMDTSGAEGHKALREQWIAEGEGFVLVYAIGSRASFSRITGLYRHILEVKDRQRAENHHASTSALNLTYRGSGKPIVIVGNKCDRFSERDVRFDEGQALAKQLLCGFSEASARNGVNIEKASYDVVRAIRLQQKHAASEKPRRMGGPN